MSEQLFVLSLTDGDLFFYGPESYDNKAFRKLCLGLIETAGIRALESEKKRCREDGEAVPRPISWRDISNQIPKLLENYGFRSTSPRRSSLPHFDFAYDNYPEELLGRAKAPLENHNRATKAEK